MIKKRHATALAAALAALLAAAPAAAQRPNNTPRAAGNAEASENLVQRTEVWGDWNGTEPSRPLATSVYYYYYDNDNRLAAKMQAQNFAADDDTTEEVEKEGDQRPLEFFRYVYDNAGNRVRTEKSKYVLYGSKTREWSQPETVERNSYDAAGHLVYTKASAGTASRYTWENGNLTERSDTAQTGEWSKTTVYQDFAAGAENLPQSDYSVSKWKQMFAGKYTYDSANRPLTYTQTQIKKATADPLTHHLTDITLADAPYSLVEYDYAEDGSVRSVTYSYWSSAKAAFVPNTRESREPQSDGGCKVSQHSYNSATESWSGYASHTVEYTASYSKGSAPEATQAAAGLDGGTGVAVSCPTGGKEGGVWKVYRNGEHIGDAAVNGATATYEDKGLHNSVYTYFMQHTGTDGKGGNVSLPATVEVGFPYPAPANVRVVSEKLSGVASRKTWKVEVAWDAPEQVEGLTLKSFNVLCDISASNPYPTPANDKVQATGEAVPNPLAPTTTGFTVSWDAEDDPLHTICVEAVYDLGRAKSAPVTVNLGKTGKRVLESRSQMGDLLGEGSDSEASKVTRYYYDDSQRLTREVSLHRLAGDDEGTPDIVEKEGDYQADALRLYDYDAKGNLTAVRERKYGLYQGYQLAWGEDATVSSYKYDESNRCTEWEDGSKRYAYTWDGENLVKEEQYIASTGKLSATLVHSDFVAGKANLPQRTVKDGAYSSSQRVIETAYDAAGNKTAATTYKYGEVTRDADGNVTAVEKGTPEYSEAWTYEDGVLTLYTKQKWNAAGGAFADYLKTEYRQGYNAETEVTYTYSGGTWKSGRPYRNTYKTVYSGTAATKFAAAADGTRLNTVKITAAANTALWGSPSYLVYRNGVCIGKAAANATGRQLSFTDANVPNGTWDYFMQPDNTTANVTPAATTPASVAFATELPAVTKLTKEERSKDAEYYKLSLAWEAPETDIPIVGYNVYTDIRPFTKNPVPDNDEGYLTQPEYDWQWIVNGDSEKSVYIEVVYNIGRKRSEAFLYKLDDAFTGIRTARNGESGAFSTEGGQLRAGSGCRRLELYAAAGTRLAAGGDSIRLSALPQGVYVAKALMDDGRTVTAKVVNR